MPEKIEPEHLTPSLKAFLRNVRSEVLSIHARLENLFEILWSASEKFWAYQKLEQSKHSGFKKFAADATSMRDAFKKRRQETTKPSSNPTKMSKEQTALQMMGFATLPSMDDLKKKYRELARTLHPDAGGDEAKFKDLTESYTYLSQNFYFRRVSSLAYNDNAGLRF